MSTPLGRSEAAGPPTGAPDWEKAQAEPEFQELRRRLRSFVFPVSGLFLAWYLLYVLLSVYAPDFMSTKIGGNFNIGLLMGLLQFVTTFAITWWYVRWANRRFDPLARSIREELEQR
ncbi:DUF485 domain-containing protein [Pseudonocardia thermophila]|jgi:Predicted membrane protein|uniref:DUF485 domain-containing protein n=1 Tax=Pseudonocardia thermophila TaxID=1848 RepID=UPI00248E5BAC|nr:DUF485 domain-containing protein [Pseudonocardia thermophila]